MRTGLLTLSVVSLALLAGRAPAIAERDHLTGYKVKDGSLSTGGMHVFDDGYGPQNCELKKVQFFLTQSERDAEDDPRGGPAGDFVCYKAKCSSPLPTLSDQEDEVGAHTLTAKKVKIVCLPSTPACEATTGGFCWFVGTAGADCDTTCASVGRVYDVATRTYAGSDGSDANCAAVLSDLGVTSPFAGSVSCGNGLGCFGDVPSFTFGRCTEITIPTAAAANRVRVCACQ